MYNLIKTKIKYLFFQSKEEKLKIKYEAVLEKLTLKIGTSGYDKEEIYILNNLIEKIEKKIEKINCN